MPLKRNRISNGVYVFTSGMYAEVTATVIFTDEGTVLVDTLPFPQETASCANSSRSVANLCVTSSTLIPTPTTPTAPISFPMPTLSPTICAGA